MRHGTVLSIQYLRAIAALSVVWLHELTSIPGFIDALGPPRFGGSGVDIFFVISGFIMVYTVSAKPVGGARFFALRIIRVVPLYWICTLAMVGLTYAGLFKTVHWSPVTLAKSLAFIPYGPFPVLAPGWTLNFEMFFYALFALTLGFPRWVMGAVLLALVAAGFMHPENVIAQTYTSPLLLEFLAGMVLAQIWLRNWAVNLPVGLVLMAGGCTILYLHDGLPLHGFSQVIGSALMVGGALNDKLSRWKNRLLKELGDASYSIYLTHLFPLAGLRLLALSMHVWPLPYMLMSLVVSSVTGWLCYRVLERPLTKYLGSLALAQRMRRLVRMRPRFSPR